MAGFPVSDAAFTGFAIVRHRPRAVALWVVAHLIVSGGISTLMVMEFGPLIQQITAMGATQSQDPAQAMAMLPKLAPLYAFGLVFSLVFYPILFATMNRAVLRPNDDAFGYIRLGADEFRQLGLLVMVLLLGICAEVILAIAGTIVAALVIALTHNPGLGGFFGVLTALCAAIFVMVRLSLASAQTFATGKITLFGSWSLTKGRFWPIFGVYALAFALLVVVSLLGYVVIFAVMAAVGGGHDIMSAMTQPQSATITNLFSPARIIQLVLGAALGAITWPIMTTPAPAIYKAIVGDGSSPADVF